jgi:hypothetical protein
MLINYIIHLYYRCGENSDDYYSEFLIETLSNGGNVWACEDYI